MGTLLSILELSRYHAIGQVAALQTQAALESGFANYNSVLWDEYCILACEESMLESMLLKAGEERKEDIGLANNLLLFENQGIETMGSVRLTDGEGLAFRQSVSTYMSENIVYEVAKEIHNQYQAILELKENSQFNIEAVDEALEEIEKAEAENQEYTNKKSSKSTGLSKEKDIQNPLDTVKELRKKGILELFLEDMEDISEAELDKNDRVSKRELKKGSISLQTEDEDWLDRVYLQHYVLSYFSCFGQEKDGRQLSYELEYLIGGKESDLKNLKLVVTELLSIRAVCNFLYLMSDVEKINEAKSMAIVLSGGNLQLVDIIKVALLTAWAFGEAVLDVRALLHGNTIALIKNKEEWTLELSNLSLLTQKENMAKEGANGLSYQNYLGVLLLFSSNEKIAMRSMDIQEANIRKKTGNDSFCMDMLVVQTEVEIKYSYTPVFCSLNKKIGQRMWKYEMFCKESYGYL